LVEESHLRGLKTAFLSLIERAGKFDAAAAYLGFSTSKLSEAASLHIMDRAPRVDHVAKLEALVGDPAVTAQLAAAQGFHLVPRQAGPGAPVAAMHRVLQANGRMLIGTGAALEDGVIGEAERLVLLRDIAAMRRCLDAAEAALAGPALPVGKGVS
jgi:hypothetical protein